MEIKTIFNVAVSAIYKTALWLTASGLLKELLPPQSPQNYPATFKSKCKNQLEVEESMGWGVNGDGKIIKQTL